MSSAVPPAICRTAGSIVSSTPPPVTIATAPLIRASDGGLVEDDELESAVGRELRPDRGEGVAERIDG